MAKPYKYHLRSGYGSDKLLLEFILTNSDKEFEKDLLTTLKDINPKVDAVEDLWINDEVLFHVSSDKGSFLVTKDIWDFVFIIADENQAVIKLIDNVLKNCNLFDREEVDFENYKNIKN